MAEIPRSVDSAKTLHVVTSFNPQPPHVCIELSKACKALVGRLALDGVVLGECLALTLHLSRRGHGRDAKISGFCENPAFRHLGQPPAPARVRRFYDAGKALVIRYTLDGVMFGEGLELTLRLNQGRNGRDAEISGFRENPAFRHLGQLPAPARVRRFYDAGKALVIRYTLDRVMFGEGLELTLRLNQGRNGRDLRIPRKTCFCNLCPSPALAPLRSSFQSWQGARSTSCLGRSCA